MEEVIELTILADGYEEKRNNIDARTSSLCHVVCYELLSLFLMHNSERLGLASITIGDVLDQLKRGLYHPA